MTAKPTESAVSAARSLLSDGLTDEQIVATRDSPSDLYWALVSLRPRGLPELGGPVALESAAASAYDAARSSSFVAAFLPAKNRAAWREAVRTLVALMRAEAA